MFCAILSLKDRQAIMAIKEPVFIYRKYGVTPTVEYIPCLPMVDNVHPTATRIPKGSEVKFLSKYDNELVKVSFQKENSKDEFYVLVMTDFLCENLLPIYRKNG